VGLLASTSGRLYSSAFYALRDTRTPLKFAALRVALTVALGYLFALPMPLWLGIDRRWGVAGLTLSAGIAGWVEFALLRRSLQTRIGNVPYSIVRLLKLWLAALIAGAAALGIRHLSPTHHPVVTGAIVLIPYGHGNLDRLRRVARPAPPLAAGAYTLNRVGAPHLPAFTSGPICVR
jgi:putative peptidoglycan lipid II flippase